MSSDILIRDFPDGLRRKIDDDRKGLGLSRKEYIIRVLERVLHQGGPGQLELFGPPQRTEYVPAALPFRFVDLFAGIGGFRTALERLGGACVFSSEWDVHCRITYKAWYGEEPAGDIRLIRPEDIPDHDVLAAGFPCQPFSIAGVSKKNSLGRLHGFRDAAQGTLFFTLAAITEVKRPPILLLENVKNLKSHDGGHTWQVIKATLEDLKYKVFDSILDAAFWVPQHRERIFIVCFDRRVFGEQVEFRFPAPPAGPAPRLRDILDRDPAPKYTLSDRLWHYLQEYAERHRAKGNGFGFGLADPDGVARTLSARYYKDGSEILVPTKRNPRRLTPKECLRLMGFPEDRPIVVSDTQAYRQFGNAVVPKVVEAVGRETLRTVFKYLKDQNGGSLIVSAHRAREQVSGVLARPSA